MSGKSTGLALFAPLLIFNAVAAGADLPGTGATASGFGTTKKWPAFNGDYLDGKQYLLTPAGGVLFAWKLPSQ